MLFFEKINYFFGSSAYALQTEVNPTVLCDPSQNGFFSLEPHRQRETTVLPARSYFPPDRSKISNSPSMRREPLSFAVIFAGIVRSSRSVSHKRLYPSQESFDKLFPLPLQ